MPSFDSRAKARATRLDDGRFWLRRDIGPPAITRRSPGMNKIPFAMFGHTKTITLHGTVKEFQYTNPHSWLEVMILSRAGTAVRPDR
jgi:Family of unknown function (DUF6152)